MIALALIAQLALGSVRVIDGDTIHDNDRQHTYRLAGIDTPEIGKAACERERALGEAAAARVRDLLAGAHTVTAAPSHDPRGRKQWPTDGFGRRLAVITLDGRDLGEILLAEGLAQLRAADSPDWCAEPLSSPSGRTSDR